MIPDFFPIDLVEKKINIKFKDRSLLFHAFVHRSFWNENKSSTSYHNERLEFLGDSVLGLILADYLFKNYPDLNEGTLSKLRSQLIDSSSCLQYVQHLGLSEFLLLGKGEKMNQGKGRQSILADLFETVIGAIYLDQGLQAAYKFFFDNFKDHVERQVVQPMHNWKAELQDWAQKKFQDTPVYKVLEEIGSPHNKQFSVGVWVMGSQMGKGIGYSKKEAEMMAAQDALSKLESQ